MEDVKDVMEALLNLAALEFSIRPHSYQALVMLRVIHENNIGANHTKTALNRSSALRHSARNACSRTMSGHWQEKGPWSTRRPRGCSRMYGSRKGKEGQ